LTDISFYEPEYGQLMRWFLVQIKPNGQERARKNLSRQGFSLFCPLEPSTCKRRGRFGKLWRELFPGYLFVGLDPATSPWRKINCTYGVSRLVAFGEAGPKPLPEGLIAGLRGRCNADGHLMPPETLHPGDKVRIIAGAFANFATTVERITPDQRIWVLLDLLGRRTPIALSREHLQPA